MARPDAAQARGGLPQGAEHPSPQRGGRDLPQSFHTDRTLRSGPREPADRPLPDESSRSAEHHSSRRALHQSRPRVAQGRLRRGPGRLHHDHARPAHDGTQRSALPGAGRHHGRLPPRRRLRALQGRLFRLGREPGLQAAGEPRGHLAARGPHAGGRAGQRRHGAALAPAQGAVGHRLVHRARPHLSEEPRRQAVVPASRLLPSASALHRPGALSRDVPARGHAQGRARAECGGGGQATSAARLLRQQHQPIELLPGRQGTGLGDDRRAGGADARDLLRPDERGRRPARPRLRLPEGERASGTTR